MAQIKTHRADEPSTRVQTPSSAQPNAGEKRMRCVDKLDGPSQASKQPTVISGAERRAPLQDVDTKLQPARKRIPSRDPISPDQTTEPGLPSRRVTRSQDGKEQLSSDQNQSESRPKLKVSETEALGPPWIKDLVYPQPGRRAAIVPFDDLRRLDDDEFLNDNLILFFMRYLETHMEKNNPELYKRMHFFNTYFYEALTKTSRGKKALNFDAVSRWTKNINLFSRDFVIVPVNENFHWYLAIICNLSYFVRGSGHSGWAEDAKSVDQQSEEFDKEVDPPTAETQKSLADLSISDGEKDDLTPTKKKGFGRRKSVRRSLPKYEVNKPIVITLDSLGYSRSTTCSQLKQYVALEAKDKQNLDIDPSELRGMTAKEIPTQSNFSDCGLYLCVYLEQFVADPYNFIRRILQREENAQQWPRRIHSKDLRSRLRELILEMHRKQEKESSKMDEPVIGSILIDKRELCPSPPPVPQKPRTKLEIQEAQQRFEELTNTRSEQSDSEQDDLNVSRDLLVGAYKTPNAVGAIPDSQDGHDDEGEDDILICEQDSRAVPSFPSGSQPNHQSPRKHARSADTVVVQVCASALANGAQSAPTARSVLHSTPAELAKRMRRETVEHDSHKRRRLTREESPEKMRKARSPSQSSQLTDFLSGIKSYAARASTSPTRVVNDDRANGAGTKDGEKVVNRAREATSPSPGPEIIAARTISPTRRTPSSKKRKRTPGMKMRAPETAHDVAEWNGFGTALTLEVPESQETEFGQNEAGTGQDQGRAERDVANDREMLFR